MYIAAIIQLPEGKQKIIDAGPFTIPKFILELSRYAKEENKLVKVVSDHWQILSILSKQLPGVKVEWGNKETLKMEFEKMEAK